MKRDPSIERLLRGDLLALSPLGFAAGRDAMLEALLDLLPAHTQRDPGDPGVALIEALAAVLEIFGFYHDRIVTESKIGSAQLLQSVALLGDVVGYTPRPALAAAAYQFFEARALGVVPAGSKLAARLPDVPGKVVFETLRSLSIGPAFNRMALEPIIARQVGARRAVIRRLADVTTDHVSPIDEFEPGDLAMINGIAGLELVPVADTRSRAIAVERPLRRSYGLLDTRLHCATEYRHLRNGHPLGPDTAVGGHDDLIAFEVSERPILHIPQPGASPRLRSTLEVYVLDGVSDPDNPRSWTPDRRWEEVPDFTASEAADRHYRVFVDDCLRTYILLRRRLGYRTLLRDDQLDRVYARFTPAVGDVVPVKTGDGPPELTAHVVRLNDEYFTSPIILPRVDGELVQTQPSFWVVTDRDMGLLPGRQIIIENAETREKFIRTLGPRTSGQYLHWLVRIPGAQFVDLVSQPPRPLWDRLHDDIMILADSEWRKGLTLHNFGHYFPLDLKNRAPDQRVHYPVLPGRGVAHNIPEALLYVADIPDCYNAVAGWSTPGSLSISPLRSATKAGPYHLWDQFYRHFENLDWALRDSTQDPENAKYELMLFPALAPKEEENEEGDGEPDDEKFPEPVEQPKEPPDHPLPYWGPETVDHRLKSVVIVPRGSTFLIVQDTSLIRPGDYFLLGKRDRFPQQSGQLGPGPKDIPPPQPDKEDDDAGPDIQPANELDALVMHSEGFTGNPGDFSIPPADDGDDGVPQSSFDPKWRVAEILQAVEVHGKIVRLKWPTQNEYTVNFLVGEEDNVVNQPINELIVVPQVASVFFGERFRQKIKLYPNEQLTQDVLGGEQPEGIVALHLAYALNAAKLRKKTGWHFDQFEKSWDDLFFTILYPWDGNEVEVNAPAVNNVGLEWGLMLYVEKPPFDNLNLIEGLRIGAKEIEKKTDFLAMNDLPFLLLSDGRYAFRINATDISAEALSVLSKRYSSVTDARHWIKVKDEKNDWGKIEIEDFNEGVIKIKFDDNTLKLEPLLVPEMELLLSTGEYVKVLAYQPPGHLTIVDFGDGLPEKKPKWFKIAALPSTPTEGSLAELRLFLTGTFDPKNLPVFLPESLDPAKESPSELLDKARFPQKVYEGVYDIERIAPINDEHVKEFIDSLGYAQKLPPSGNLAKVYHAFYNQRDTVLSKPNYNNSDDPWLKFNNFLRVNFVYNLMVATKPDLAKDDNDKSLPTSFLLFSIDKALTDGQGVAGTIDDDQSIKWMVLTESVIFNSGNFIPVRLSTPPDHDHKIVANSLDIRFSALGEDRPDVRIQYENDILEVIGALKSGNLPDTAVEGPYRFSFNKTPEGTFTLNFLLMGYFREDPELEVLVDVIYTAEPFKGQTDLPPDDPNKYTRVVTYPICDGGEPVEWRESCFYEFETRPLPWNPLRQLVILNSGDLKAGDYLFVDPSAAAGEYQSTCADKTPPDPPPPAPSPETQAAARARDFIQWTRVVEVDGRMVMVDPPLKIQPRGFYHYRVTGYRRPPDAAIPDPDFYALLQSEEKKQDDRDPTVRELSFGNRLMLRPFEEIDAPGPNDPLAPIERRWLLDHLVPGDRLLVWDDRWRRSWHDHRRTGAPPQGHAWWDWPDWQHEVVIKRIVPRLGIVELEQRMPPHFGVEYPSDAVEKATEISVDSFRALPFYREPFQGLRELVAIGDGDRRRKFARLPGLVDEALGLASVALDRAGTVASNIEVLTVETSAGEWNRWTEFARIDDARAKDRAFVLGLAPPTENVPPECKHVPLTDAGEPTPARECCCPEKTDVPRPPGLDEEGDLVVGELDLAGDAPRVTEVSVSFGDGIHGQLLPNGVANVFIRPVRIGRWCAHFPAPTARLLLDVGQRCLPFPIHPDLASARNLALVAEHGAHHQWQPRAGVDRWPSSIVVEIDLSALDLDVVTKLLELAPEQFLALERELPRDRVLRLREVSEAEAREGRDGVLVCPARPGVVELFLVWKYDLAQLLGAADPLGAAALRERVTVYEWPRTELWRLDRGFYDEALANDPTQRPGAGLVLLGETEGLVEGSLLGFVTGGATASTEVAEVVDVGHATYSATLRRGLERTYDLERSHLVGNLVEIVQGSSERHVLGSGDGATRELRLPLGNREPILYSSLHATTPGELAPGVVVLVDNIPWQRIAGFEGRGPRERVYRLEVEASGKCHVRFGDGVNGAIPAAGLDNIVAVIRTGDGARGNVPAGLVDKLLDGNLAVERTRNVTPGAGGKAADDAAQAREHLMTRSFTHGRVITADDVLRAARALGNIVQASLDPTAPAGVLRVVVALADRQPATPEILDELAQRLLAAMPLTAGVALELVEAVQVGVHLSLEISVNPGFFEAEVVAALERAFAGQGGGFFALERWPIGEPLRVGDIYEHAFTLPGVATARVRWLAREVEPTTPPARVPEVLQVLANEVLRCDGERTDRNPQRGAFRVTIKRGGR